ncbi:MAG: sigma-70 family RNA polymerase sigma factor [Bacteroidota bacterium]
MIVTDEIKERKDKMFEEEFLPHMKALYNFAFHLTFDEENANDLVQETYLKAYRFIDSYQKGTNSKAWLFKILKNEFINNYRKKSKQPNSVDFDSLLNYHESDDPQYVGSLDLRQEIFQNMMGDEVTIAVNKLPVEFKTIIILCDVEGFTYEELSKILDIPIGTVRSRLFRARNMLKEYLRKYALNLGYKENR